MSTRHDDAGAVVPAPIPAGWREDSQGRLVREDAIPVVQRLRDDLVRRLAGQCEALAVDMARVKAALLGEVAEHIALIASEYGADITGRSGDVALESFDGRLRIERSSARRVRVTESIHAAEALVRRYIDRQAADMPDGIRTIVDRTFRRSRKTGELNVSRLLDFAAVEIDDDDWRAAVAAIKASLEASESVTYFRAYRRASASQPWEQIPLDFSRMDPAPTTIGGRP
jgi:hypothetical protein